MSLFNRTMGSELSQIEWALTFDKKYVNVGYVEYHSKSGNYFFLQPSPFLKRPEKEIYYCPQSPLPENHSFIEIHIVEETSIYSGTSGGGWIPLKIIDRWQPFDPSPLAARRKTMDFLEIIDYFTRYYKGEADSVIEIAGCTSLFAVSSPHQEQTCGGIRSAVLSRDYQWKLFNNSLQILPQELRKLTSDYYYYISKIEKEIPKQIGETNIAIHRPKKLLSDIPIVILDESPKRISKDFQDQLEVESKIITAHILDALLIRPQTPKKVEKLMLNEIHRMREQCFSVGLMPYNQNMGAIPKLATSYCRLQSSADIRQEDVQYVTDLWFDMWRRAEQIESSPIKTSHMLELTGDARKIFLNLYDIFGAENEISMVEAIRESKLEALDLELAVDSLENKGYCIRKEKSFILLEPYKK